MTELVLSCFAGGVSLGLVATLVRMGNGGR